MKEFLEKQGDFDVRKIEGRGWCGIKPFIFTFGIFHGADNVGYSGRWCYATKVEAEIALKYWNGVGDPIGNWIKYKGKSGERGNLKK